MLTDILTISVLRTWTDPQGVSHSHGETVTADLSDIGDPRRIAAADVLRAASVLVRPDDEP